MNNFHKFQNFRQFSNLFSQIWVKKATHVILFWNLSRNPNKIRRKIHRKQNSTKKLKKSEIRYSFAKKCWRFWLKFWDWRTVQRSALCRSRRELSNEYLLAKIGVDTAEKEPLEVWGKIFNNFHKIQNFRQISDLFSQIWLKKRHTSLFSGIWREIRKKFIKNSQKKMQNSNCLRLN